MNEIRFYEAQSKLMSLIIFAIAFGVISAYAIYTSYFMLLSDFSIKRLMETLFVVLFPIGLLLLSCFGIYLTIKSKKPIIVVNDNGISFPSSGKEPLTWNEIRCSEISDQKIHIYLKPKETNEIPPTLFFRTTDIDYPDKLLKWINHGVKEYRGNF